MSQLIAVNRLLLVRRGDIGKAMSWTPDEALEMARLRSSPLPRYHGPKCPAPGCGSRRTKRLAQGYPIRQCCEPNCGRSSLYGALVPEKGEA